MDQCVQNLNLYSCVCQIFFWGVNDDDNDTWTIITKFNWHVAPDSGHHMIFAHHTLVSSLIVAKTFTAEPTDLARKLQQLHLTTMNNDSRQQVPQQLVQQPASKPVNIQDSTATHLT